MVSEVEVQDVLPSPHGFMVHESAPAEHLEEKEAPVRRRDSRHTRNLVLGRGGAPVMTQL